MSNELEPLPNDTANGFPMPLDMTEILKYEDLVNEITRINGITGPFYMQEFLKSINVASSLYTKILWQYEQSVVSSKAVKGRLRLDSAPGELKRREIKVTEDAITAYVESHPEYLKEMELVSYYKALMNFLYQKVEKFERAHDDARKIYDGTRERFGSVTSLPSGEGSDLYRGHQTNKENK
jgi:hypothetical protein